MKKLQQYQYTSLNLERTMYSRYEMFLIQHIRNVHLYRYVNIVYPHIITPKTPYLALCGNIIHPTDSNYRIYKSFLRYCSDHWEKVFYVPGPTELIFPEAIQQLCESHKNIHFLDTNTYKVPRLPLQVIGANSLYSSREYIKEAIYNGVDNKCDTLLLSYQYNPLFISVSP